MQNFILLLAFVVFNSQPALAQFSDPSEGLPKTSSDYKILEDLKTQTITADQAWLYRVQARFAKAALPEKYQATPIEPLPGVDPNKYSYDQNHLSPQFLNEVAEALPTMSAETQDAIIPFLMPPAAEAQGLLETNTKVCPGNKPIPNPVVEGEWIYDDRDPTFRFWYVIYPNFGKEKYEWLINRALPILIAAKTKYEKLLGIKLLDDTGGGTFIGASGKKHTFCDGGNGKYDIYFNTFEENFYGVTVAYPGKTSRAPSFIILDHLRLHEYLSRTDFTAAHELFHAFQFAHERNLPIKVYSDSDEGMANWAANYVLPNNDYEHAWDTTMLLPEFSILKRHYDSWVIYYYATQMYGNQFIQQLLQAEANQKPFQAMDSVVTGGLKKFFPEFSIKAANVEDIIGTSFLSWDRVRDVPRKMDQRFNPLSGRTLNLDGRGEFTFSYEYELGSGLTRFYDHFKIPSEVKSITLSWGKGGVPEDNFHFRLLKKIGGSWVTEDWDPKKRPNKYKFKESICFDDPQTERFEEMVISVSRSDITPQYGIWDDSKIKVSIGANNLPCYAVVGKGSLTKTITNGIKDTGNFYEEKYYSDFNVRFEAKRDADGRLTDKWEAKSLSAKYNISIHSEKFDPCADKSPTSKDGINCRFMQGFNILNNKIERCQGSKSGTINTLIERSKFSISSLYTTTANNYRAYNFAITPGEPEFETVRVDCPNSNDTDINFSHQPFVSMSASIPTVNAQGKIHDTWSQPGQGDYVWDFEAAK